MKLTIDNRVINNVSDQVLQDIMLNMQISENRLEEIRQKYQAHHKNEIDFVNNTDTVRKSCLHDGTLYFSVELIAETLMQTLQSDCNFGNPMLITEVNSTFSPSDKPWLTCRDTVIFPVCKV